MGSENLPCPFCGSPAQVLGYTVIEAVTCSNGKCQMRMLNFSPEYWNTRPTSVLDKLVAEVEGMERRSPNSEGEMAIWPRGEWISRPTVLALLTRAKEGKI